MPSDNFTYVSLFSGAGGLDIGFERAGFKGISMNEVNPTFAATLRANAEKLKSDGHTYFAGTSIIEADIRDLHGRDHCWTHVASFCLSIAGSLMNYHPARFYSRTCGGLSLHSMPKESLEA